MSADPWHAPPHEHEAALREEWNSLSERHVADAAGSVLAVAIDRATANKGTPEQEPIKLAVLVAAIRAFRAIRAAMAAAAAGYELEAEAMNRAVLELFVSARAALDDSTGQEAQAWLAGKRTRGIGRRVDAAMPRRGVYGALSQAVHGDPRGLVRLLGHDDDEQVIEWGPNRSDRAYGLLFAFAVGARDFAVLLEEAGLGPHPELTPLDTLLEAKVPGFKRDRVWS